MCIRDRYSVNNTMCTIQCEQFLIECTCSVNSVWILHCWMHTVSLDRHFLIECTSSVNSVLCTVFRICRLCICAFMHICGRLWHRLSNAHPMCMVYRMHIDLLSGVYFTVFTVKRFHQFKPHLEMRQSRATLIVARAHNLNWPRVMCSQVRML